MSSIAIVYGGSGALGKGIVSFFAKNNWRVLSIDFVANDEAAFNVLLEGKDSWTDKSNKVLEAIAGQLKDAKVQAIVNVAGGWTGGNITDAAVIANTELMLAQSVQSSLVSGQLAAKHLNENGLLVLTGANAALKGTAGMIAYGTAKAAVHHLVKSFAAADSGLPAGAHSVGLLPITIDTPANRKWASADTDFGSWTPVDAIASKILGWATGADKVTSGDLVQVITAGGQTAFNVVG